MRKITLLIVFSLVTSLLSIHLPWIYDETTGIPPVSETQVVEKVEYSYWPFMAKKTTYNYAPTSDYHWSATEYLLFNQLWGKPPSIGSLIFQQIGMRRPLSHLWEGYYIIFLFELLTVLFLLVCMVTERWDAPLQQAVLYITTFLISLGALTVGVNQYAQDWGFDGGVTLGHIGGRSLVQFDIGFYLALVSSILTLTYALSSIIKMLRE